MIESILIKQDQVASSLAVLICDQINFKLKQIKRDKEQDFILIKGAVYQEDITILNILHQTLGRLIFF